MSEALNLEIFLPHVGTSFSAATPSGPVALGLVETKPLGQALRDGGAFALYFVGPPTPLLPQAIYPMAHESLGTLDLFIVPIGRDKDGTRYEAIFT